MKKRSFRNNLTRNIVVNPQKFFIVQFQIYKPVFLIFRTFLYFVSNVYKKRQIFDKWRQLLKQLIDSTFVTLLSLLSVAQHKEIKRQTSKIHKRDNFWIRHPLNSVLARKPVVDFSSAKVLSLTFLYPQFY